MDPYDLLCNLQGWFEDVAPPNEKDELTAESLQAHAEAAEKANRAKRRSSGGGTVEDDVPLVIESLVGEDEDKQEGAVLQQHGERHNSSVDCVETDDLMPVSPAVVAEMEEEHAELVTDIINDQEGLVAAHREQIHEMMNLVKQEMTALDEVEAAGASVDDYVESLEIILASKASIVSRLRRQRISNAVIAVHPPRQRSHQLCACCSWRHHCCCCCCC